LFLPGSFSIVPALLPDEDLQAGNALASSATQLATLAGPVAGGAVVAILGPAPAFAIDAATFIVSALTLAGIRAADRAAPTAQAAVGPETETDGDHDVSVPNLRTLLRSQRVLQVMLLVVVAANLGSGALGGVVIPSFARGPLHAGPVGYGGLIAAFAGGALIGTIISGQAGRARRPAVVGSVAFLGAALFMAAVPYLGGIIPAGAALAAFGLLNGFGNVVMITTFQRWAPPELLGRVTGLLMLASFGIFPVSVALGALVVHDLGPAPFFPLAAAALAIAIAAGLSQQCWRDLGALSGSARAADPDQVPGGGRPGTAQVAADLPAR
jgi:predicted MFS family arabinose efflux permease